MSDAAGIRVLHVDDEPGLADMVGTFLERENDRFAVETARNAEEGLDRLADGDFDCVISDYDMPGQNGIEFLSAVREEYPDLPFILHTGKGSEEVASDAITAGVTDYLQKESGTDQYKLLANRVKNAVEQHRAKEQVVETEQRLQTIAEHTHDILWQFTADWDELLFVNSAYEEIWGRSITELRDDPYSFIEGVHPDDRASVEVAAERLSAGKSVDIEYRVNADEDFGRWVWVLAEPIFDDAGEVESVIGFARDVTERKESEPKVRRKARQLEGVLNTVGAAIFIKDTEGRYQLMNRECKELLGLDLDQEIDGLTDDSLFPADVAERFLADDRRVLENGEPIKAEEAVPTKGGTRVFLTLKSPLFDEGGEPWGVCAVSTDVTADKDREQELQRQNERLDKFAGIVSHDLKNPLNVAQGRLELAREACESEHLAYAADAVDRSLDLIDDMLALAREGETVREYALVDLADTIESCWRTIETGGATLVSESEQTVLADPSRLKQLLENLFYNAVEHGGEDVTVAVNDLDDGFYVADTGPGISEDDPERVFDVGYSSKNGGTGFGLNIVKEIADAHGWNVSVTDSETGGARFEITGVTVEGE